MKTIHLILFLLISFGSFGQGSDIERNEIWDEVVIHIQHKQPSKVLDRTKFPIQVGEKELSENKFINVYSTIFNDYTMNSIEMGPEELDWVEEGLYTFMLIGDDEKFDFADLYFQRLNGSWWLVKIELEKL